MVRLRRRDGAGPYTLADIGPYDSAFPNGAIQKLPNGGIWTWTPDALTPGESNSATVITGACCEPLGGCTDDVTQATCLNGFGTWFEAQTCGLVVCPPDKGACCMPDGGCVDYMTAAECDDYCYNSAWHQSDLCSTAGCTPQDVGRCCMYIGVCIDVPECE